MSLLQQKCPEVLELTVAAPLFSITSNDNDTASNGVQRMASQFNAPFWGPLPLDPLLLRACERGECFTLSYPTKTASTQLMSFVEQLTTALPVAMDTGA
jgi:hypothetical protein